MTPQALIIKLEVLFHIILMVGRREQTEYQGREPTNRTGVSLQLQVYSLELGHAGSSITITLRNDIFHEVFFQGYFVSMHIFIRDKKNCLVSGKSIKVNSLLNLKLRDHTKIDFFRSSSLSPRSARIFLIPTRCIMWG